MRSVNMKWERACGQK